MKSHKNSLHLEQRRCARRKDADGEENLYGNKKLEKNEVRKHRASLFSPRSEAIILHNWYSAIHNQLQTVLGKHGCKRTDLVNAASLAITPWWRRGRSWSSESESDNSPSHVRLFSRASKSSSSCIPYQLASQFIESQDDQREFQMVHQSPFNIEIE